MKTQLIFLMALVSLAACTPTEQAFHPAADAKPALTEKTFIAADGAELPMRSWLPKGKAKAVIVAIHGFNDYSHAFQSTGEFFSKHNVAVYAYDQRGFGASPEHGIWGGEQNLTGDLKSYVQRLSARYPHTPVYVLGESMGGAVAIDALSDPDFPKVQGVILSAPAVWGSDTLNPLYRGTLWTAAHTVPFHELTGSSLKILASNNIPMLRRLGADPLVIKSTRIDAIYGMVGLMDSAYDKAPTIKTPLLILYGAHDQVIPKHPIDQTLNRFNQPVTFVYYPEGYHMLLRDLQGELVMKDILGWIKHPSAPLPSGFSSTYQPEAK